MTKLTIVSGFTTIAQGRVDVGDIDLNDTTILDLKRKIQQFLMDEVPPEQLHLWWRGYRLDGDDQPLLRTCLGATQEGESLDVEAMETLVLFLTVPLERRRCNSDESSSSSSSNGGPFSPFRARSLSDLITAIRQELATTSSSSSPKDHESALLSCNIV